MLDAYFNRLITDTADERRTRLLDILDKMGAAYQVDKTQIGERQPVNVRVPLHDNAKPYIIVGAHYDSPIGSSGANDNVAGLSVALGILRVFHFIKLQKRRPIPLEFVFFDMGEDEMQQGFVVGGFLFPAHENASVAIEPRCDSFHDPAASAAAMNSFFAACNWISGSRADQR